MNRSKKQIIILGFLVLVMAVVYGRALLPKSSDSSVSSESEIPKATLEIVKPLASRKQFYSPSSQELESIRKQQRERMEGKGWSQDPFIAGSVNGSLSGLSLSGIMWDPSNPMAIINGQLVHVGDHVETYQIVTITQDEVSVTDGIEIFKLNTAQ